VVVVAEIEVQQLVKMLLGHEVKLLQVSLLVKMAKTKLGMAAEQAAVAVAMLVATVAWHKEVMKAAAQDRWDKVILSTDQH
jgi:hypothetical protein